jgi:hypothetical protein
LPLALFAFKVIKFCYYHRTATHHSNSRETSTPLYSQCAWSTENMKGRQSDRSKTSR